ncbi:MAG: PorV/PorQ family protein [Elusimicrobia bacterium]|nr:PorV/PorQ family protein [Elusimicrobiota bacterium]
MIWIHANNTLASGPGTDAATFLTIGFGSRAQSLGNALVALANDASSSYFNPAGLAQARGGLNFSREIQASRSSWFQGIDINQLAWARYHPSATSWALAATNLSVDDLEWRSMESEQPEGYFQAGDLSLGISAARTFQGPISAGVTLKIIQQRIAGAQGEALAIDAGTQYSFRAWDQKFSAGLAFRNLGTRLKLGSSSSPLPLSIHAGLAYQGLINQVLEFSFDETRLTNISIGTEYWFLGILGLRGGYWHPLAGSSDSGTNTFIGLPARPGLTGGLGFIVTQSFGLDYAFVPFGDLGLAQRLTMSYRF